MPAPPAAPPPARVAPVPVNPPPPLACPTIEQLIAEDDTWTLKDWFSCLLCPVAPRHSKGGGASRSKGSRLEPPSKPKSSPLEPPKKRQRTDDEAKSVEDVAALVGGKCELNTETGPVAVVYLPQLTEVLSQQGLEYVSRPDARVDIQTPLKDLDPALVKELDAGVLVLNEALQKSPNDRQGEKFTERLVAWVHALLAKVCRLVVGDFFEIDMTPTSVKAHIPDAEIWFGDSLRGILEAKKGVKGEGVVNAMQRFFEGRMTAEPAGRRFSVCALSELPGSPESGVQNLIAKVRSRTFFSLCRDSANVSWIDPQALQAALSVPAGPGSKNNPFLLVFQDWGIFIPAVVWRLSSKPKSLPLGLVVDSVKRAAQLRKLPPPLISPFQPSSSYQPYLLVMGQATTLDTRFEVDKSSYILSLLAGGATPSAVFAAVSKSLGKSARQLMLQLGISSTQVQAASSVQSQAAMHMRGGAGGECSVSEAGTSVSDESMDEDGPPSDSQSGSSLTDTVTSMPSQDGSPHKYTETSDPLSLLQQVHQVSSASQATLQAACLLTVLLEWDSSLSSRSPSSTLTAMPSPTLCADSQSKNSQHRPSGRPTSSTTRPAPRARPSA